MSKGFKFATLLFAIALVCAAFGLSTRADEWNKKTVVTFNEATEVPGTVLQPGTYTFKLFDSPSERHVVQIFNQDDTKLVTTIIAVPNYRLQPTDKALLMFTERPAGSPQAVHAWFYPGDNFGWEFVYPKNRAMELAKSNKTNVLSTSDTLDTTMTDEQRRTAMQSSRVTSINPEARESELGAQTQSTPTPSMDTNAPQTNTPTQGVSPSQDATLQKTPAQTTTPQTTTPETKTPPSSEEPLPKTASPLTLVGLIGLLAVALAFTLRLILERMA